MVRLTSDCPLIDPHVIDQIVNACKSGEYDYVSNTLEPTFPDGVDVEVFKFSALKKAFDEAFAKYDVILGPVAPTTAPKLGSSLADPIKMYLGDIYTISINLAGLPGISVPCGTDSKGLPIGMQLIGDCFKEKTLIRAAYTYEQSVK